MTASAALLAGLSLVSAAAAEPQGEHINQVKAAFVLNIARFVSWPPETLDSQSDQLLLCVYRSNPFGQAVDTIRDKPVSGRRLSLTNVQNLAQSTPCNILLIAGDELQNYAAEVRQGLHRPLLTIADRTDNDTPRQLLQEVMVSLVRQGSRIGFEINLDKSLQAGLKMSSQLLKLATIVDDR